MALDLLQPAGMYRTEDRADGNRILGLLVALCSVAPGCGTATAEVLTRVIVATPAPLARSAAGLGVAMAIGAGTHVRWSSGSVLPPDAPPRAAVLSALTCMGPLFLRSIPP